MAIYVNFEKPETINEFLIKFYNQRSGYGDNMLYAAITYVDKECTQRQCDKSARSFDELLEILQTYYPSTTPEICMFHLLTVKLKNSNGRIMTPYLGVCGGMSRIKYLPYFDPTQLVDCYFDHKMTLSKYTWRELLALLKIKNLRELKKFIAEN